eukprot:GHVL01005832.1.p1 GENE.GHVL01005832.1~~GHVL01005832.1.p1  ORF type:complete len:187 (-),score=40.56 GHVL01005832.1:442-1002(-)
MGQSQTVLCSSCTVTNDEWVCCSTKMKSNEELPFPFPYNGTNICLQNIVEWNKHQRGFNSILERFVKDYKKGETVKLVRDNGCTLIAHCTLSDRLDEIRLRISKKELAIPFHQIDSITYLKKDLKDISPMTVDNTPTEIITYRATIELIHGGFATIEFDDSRKQEDFVESLKILHGYAIKSAWNSE